MPLLLNEIISGTICLGIWKIEESSDCLRSMLSLNDKEEIYIQSVRNEQRKKHWLGYRVLLREIMKDQDPEIVYDSHGKPYLKNDPRFLSVSHSGDLAAVIISQKSPAGIDIEQIRDRIERVTEKFLSEKEISSVGIENRLEKLYVCWGAKEAMYKVCGKPDVNFIHDMEIAPFNYLCIGRGSAKAEMKTPGGKLHFGITYRKINNYMLTYAIQDQV